MDEYYYFIQDQGTDGFLLDNLIEILQQKSSRKPSADNHEPASSINEILRMRKRSIMIIKLCLASKSSSNHVSAAWSHISDESIKEITGGYNTICDAINNLCNEMPLPGSCIVNVVWFKGEPIWNSSSEIQTAIPLLGSIKKLVDWHNAEFIFITANRDTHDENVASFISSANCIQSYEDYRAKCDLKTDVIWKGSFDFISEGDVCQQVHGLNIKISLNENDNNILTNDNNPPQECFLWLSRHTKVVEMINIYSVPIYLLTGSTCAVNTTHVPDKSDASTLHELYDKMVGNSCLLCMLDYAVSDNPFAAGQEYGLAEWKIATSKEDFTAPNENPHTSTSILHFILYRDPNAERKGFLCQFLQPLHAYFNQIFNTVGIENVLNDTEICDPEELLEIDALKNFNKVKENNKENIQTAKSIDSMFFQHKDVLKHFTKSGKSRASCPYLSQKSSPAFTPKELDLMKFEDALKLHHHGISFNKDDDNSEKRDRESRRLINQFIKFETASISSQSKVALPSLYVEESPDKINSGLMQNKNTEKQKKWERVAEKLYQKRLQSRSQSTSNMVLRSTPKKSIDRKQSLRETPSTRRDASLTSTRHKSYVESNRQLLQSIITKVLSKEGIGPKNPNFTKCFEKLYDISMTFLKDLKSSKNLKAVINCTVENNVTAVLNFFQITT